MTLLKNKTRYTDFGNAGYLSINNIKIRAKYLKHIDFYKKDGQIVAMVCRFKDNKEFRDEVHILNDAVVKLNSVPVIVKFMHRNLTKVKSFRAKIQEIGLEKDEMVLITGRVYMAMELIHSVDEK